MTQTTGYMQSVCSVCFKPMALDYKIACPRKSDSKWCHRACLPVESQTGEPGDGCLYHSSPGQALGPGVTLGQPKPGWVADGCNCRDQIDPRYCPVHDLDKHDKTEPEPVNPDDERVKQIAKKYEHLADCTICTDIKFLITRIVELESQNQLVQKLAYEKAAKLVNSYDPFPYVGGPLTMAIHNHDVEILVNLREAILNLRHPIDRVNRSDIRDILKQSQQEVNKMAKWETQQEPRPGEPLKGWDALHKKVSERKAGLHPARPACRFGNRLVCFPGGREQWAHDDPEYAKYGPQCCSKLCEPEDNR